MVPGAGTDRPSTASGCVVDTPSMCSAQSEWLENLITPGGLYAVDLDQRVTHWTSSAAALLGPAEQMLNRPCYEVTALLDPRNAARCRPNCAVITAARHQRAHPDFEVHIPTCDGDAMARVSVMLATVDAEPVVLHVVQPLKADPCNHDGPGAMRAMLNEAVSHVDGLERPVPDESALSLTGRQRDILARLAAGESPRDIAQVLGLSAVTVRNHIQAAMERLGARNRLEAVLTATSAGLL